MMYANTAIPDRPQIPKAFTLVELLVVIAIIGVLVAILLPVVRNAREQSRRIGDVSALHQLSVACRSYAVDNNGFLPIGRRESQAHDDYVWFRLRTWTTLQSYGATPEVARCSGMPRTWLDDQIGRPLPGDAFRDTYLGWVYWGGRQDIADAGGKIIYSSPQRAELELRPTSTTLWTCFAWDSFGLTFDGQPWPSYAPHVGPEGVLYPGGTLYQPPPDGMAVSRLDGSADFVQWDQLRSVRQVCLHYFDPQ